MCAFQVGRKLTVDYANRRAEDVACREHAPCQSHDHEDLQARSRRGDAARVNEPLAYKAARGGTPASVTAAMVNEAAVYGIFSIGRPAC